MKDRSKANRGMQFEQLINLACRQYENAGVAVIHKVPTEFLPIRDRSGKMCSAKVTHKSCVDYIGRCFGKPICAEAKNTQSGRIEYSAVQPHQAEFLDKWCEDENAVGIVLVSFGMDRFFAVPWPFWKVARETWEAGSREKVHMICDGYEWTSNGMASAKPEDLNPRWEIKRDGSYVLPFLAIMG